MSIDDILGRLKNVKHNGTGWVALCPAHDDKKQSLSIDIGNDGRTLLKCFAGCEIRDILKKVGLELKDLYNDKYASLSYPSDRGVTVSQFAKNSVDTKENGNKSVTPPCHTLSQCHG